MYTTNHLAANGVTCPISDAEDASINLMDNTQQIIAK